MKFYTTRLQGRLRRALSTAVVAGLTLVGAQSVAIGPAVAATVNVARLVGVSVTASSQNTSTGQTAVKAVDGSSLGYPDDYTREWATVGGKAGSWIQLAWASPVTLEHVVLFDRPNTNEQVTGGTLVFSDGTQVPVGQLLNAGATTVTFPPRTVDTVRFNITAVSTATANIGLAEFEVYGAVANRAPVANAGVDRSVTTGTLVTLDGSGSSDPDGTPLSYAWTQTAGGAVTLSSATVASPTFTPVADGTYVFQLTVSDGLLSATDSVTVVAGPVVSSNVARLAGVSVTASSQNTSTGQTAVKAVDGSSLGYPDDYTREWATVGGKAGSWIQLAWASPVTLEHVVLFDRPNANEQVTGGTLVFSDGTQVAVGSLTNAGSAFTVAFSARTVTSVRFNVTSVAASTYNIGLAELEAWGTVGAPVNRAPVANAGPDQSVVTGTVVGLDGSGSSDPDGTAVSYVWAQTAGGAVTLSSATVAKPTFTPTDTGTYTFGLTVSDGTLTATDTVTITVTAPVNRVPVASAGPDQSVVTGTVVGLDGSGSSDPDGTPLSYAWAQTAGGTVTLSSATVAKPTFTPVADGTYVFQLTVSDGVLSATDSVTVVAGPVVSSNVARLAGVSVTASSQNTSTGQTAVKAVDGSSLGYPSDYTKEWATVGGKAGSWIQLAWASPVTLEHVVLFDRPNTNDRVTGGTLVFSDGTQVPVGSLTNSGSAFTVAFSGRTVTSVRFNVTSVAATTYNIGLAEFEAWGTVGAPVNRAPVANAGPDQSVVTGSVVSLDGSGSSDPDGTAVSYVWAQTAGGTVTLSSATAAKPTFTPVADGTYVFQLTVSDGLLSATDSVTVVAGPVVNRVPVANAGPDQSVVANVLVTLDGLGSSDPDGTAVSYVWAQTAGGTVTLSSATVAKPTFTPTVAGPYTFGLTVSDGALTATDTVTITVAAPSVLTVANSGASAIWSANFDSSMAGRSADLQVLRIVTTMTTEVTTASWVKLGSSRTLNASGDTTFTVTNPYEVEHSYRVIIPATGSTTNEVKYLAPRENKNTGLATIYFDTNESNPITTTEDYLEGRFTMTGSTAFPQCNAVAPALMKAKGRGNYTWTLDKKPYNFSLDKKSDLCGMGSAKKWALIANHYDRSLLRNSVAMYMGSKLDNMAYTPQSIPVDVYVNGVYQGAYTLMERVNIGTTRVNIDELKDNLGGVNDSEPNVTGGYLLEWDFREGSDHNVYVGQSTGWVGIKEPEDEDDGSGITPAQIGYIDGYLDEVDDAVFADDFADPAVGWQKYIDAASAVDLYIALELTKNLDGNMYASVFMYKARDTATAEGKLYFGPIWDFDTSMGNANYPGDQGTPTGWYIRDVHTDGDFYARQTDVTWFNRMFEDPEFEAMVQARWQEVYPDLVASDAFLTTQESLIARSADANFAKWDVTERLEDVQVIKGSWSLEVDYLRGWLVDRVDWMDAQFGG